MDYVYICRDGDNEELKYSIRSVIKNDKTSNIWVIGGKPDWYSGNFIYVPQNKNKYENAHNNLKAIVNHKDISNKFVLMNDDFFIIKECNIKIQYNGGDFNKKVELYEDLAPNSSYTKKLNNTLKILNDLKYNSLLDYELHVPMIMEKKKLKEILPLVFKHDLLWRTVYGNFYKVKSNTIDDVKVYISGELAKKNINFILQDCPYISSDDKSFKAILSFYLDSMFPYPSQYEL